MNNAQQKYLKDRLQVLTRSKIEKLSDKYPDKLLDLDDRLEALQNGQFEVIDNEKLRRKSWGSWSSHVKFHGDVSNWELRQEKETEIKRESDAILDQLMLGEEAGLLDALRAFEQKEF